ncbi:MAG TPA: response regulator transcription factor [Nocardioides sp.]|nr:response regulator transcription factor [Nocardioides sp.]
MQAGTALVIEDDADIRALVAAVLAGSGFDVHQSGTGRDVEVLLEKHQPDLITLDLGLPDVDGVEVCRRIREASDAYIIMLTARTEEGDRLIGLHVGADDYMTKPFSTRELQARVTALFRRPRHPSSSATNSVQQASTPTPGLNLGGGLVIEQDRREVKVNDVAVPLTRTEFDLLVLFAQRSGQVWDRPSIVREMWQSDFQGSKNLVDAHVGNLRRKLDVASPGAVWIHTVRGIGFRLDPLS